MSELPEDSLTSSYTAGLPDILARLGISLVVSSYQTGKIILIREDKGAVNTHFRDFIKPMGIAADKNRLAVGGRNTVWDYRNLPDMAPASDSPVQHDACYLPRNVHFTGDIAGHEMDWGEEGLWLVNTKFSCLCTLDSDHSFVPRWKPNFITELKPEDRCHLNGMALADGVPVYVTALGETDSAGAWRDNKRDGGILMSVKQNRVLVKGLSMPHSPRLYNNELWFLESGKGGICCSVSDRAVHATVAELPGFTRGLDFFGHLAFIGLSQVRDTASDSFSGIPLLERLSEEERNCGIWIVDIRNGETVAFLRFESGIQEIFAVRILRNRFPEILGAEDEHLNGTYIMPNDLIDKEYKFY